jgi:hypothetical protein
MGYEIYWDEEHKRWSGYGVIAYCEFPGCNKTIDRGVSYICGGDPYNDRGCGLFFCPDHLEWHSKLPQLCKRCSTRKKPYNQKSEHPDWIKHLLADDSWEEWREENKEAVEKMKSELTYAEAKSSPQIASNSQCYTKPTAVGLCDSTEARCRSV